MKKYRYAPVVGALAVVAIIEGVLRLGFGFCDALLYQSSDQYEYIAQPNQERHRFGVRLRTNSYSQRSEEPDSTKTIVLGLGDSILFGGGWMDHDSLATTLFSDETGMQMLNISSGSWGPDNCAAYLKEKGTFGARAMVLVCSSHDAYDAMTFAPVVGVWPNYPDRQYRLAIWEAIDRYLIPYVKVITKTKTYVDIDNVNGNDNENNNVHEDSQVIQKSPYFVKGFDKLKQMADSVCIPMYIYLHAESGEVQQGRYNELGQQILQWADSADVKLINGIKEGERLEMYHDAIHLNEQGQRHLADVLKKYVKVNGNGNENDTRSKLRYDNKDSSLLFTVYSLELKENEDCHTTTGDTTL